MLASYLIKPGTIELRETPIPKPSIGEVLVKVKSALTCGTDLKAFLRGHPMIPMPGVFGHEFSGVIAEVGKGVKDFKAGDEIMAVHSAPCLKCKYCKKKLHNLCENIMDTKVLGAFAEYILLPSHIVKQNLFHKPANLSFEEAALLEPLSCVVHGMHGLNIKKGDRVLIIGTGPIGLLHLSLAKLKGAKVIITGLEHERLKLAKGLGADITVLPSGLLSAIDDVTDGLGMDFVFECTGQIEGEEQ
jgi:L-iditol 2-dehydrogenase